MFGSNLSEVVNGWPSGPLAPMTLSNGLEVSIELIEQINKLLDENTRNAEDPFQAFFRQYHYTNYAGQSFFRAAWSLAVASAAAPKGSRILDIGCFGAEALVLKNLRPDIEEYGVSIEGSLVALGSGGFTYRLMPEGDGREIAIHSVDIERAPLPFDSEFVDVITAFEVLEHFKFGPQYALGEIHRVLRPEGLLIISTPNINCLHSIWKILHGLNPRENSKYHRSLDYGIVHPLEYDSSQLRALLEGYGFTIEVLTTFYLERYTHFAKELKNIFRTLPQLLGREPDTNMLGDHFLIVARKSGGIDDPLPSQVFTT